MDLQITGLKVDAGEGSRGGNIIGHTKSGKPIYDLFKHPQHNAFTAQDHHEAAKINQEIKDKHTKAGSDQQNMEKAFKHGNAQTKHNRRAEHIREEAKE